MLHHIQRTILNQLASADSRRYSELKPAELDGNVFTYHLKSLLRDGLVAKNEGGDYSLTNSGKDYIVHRYEDPLEQAHTIFLLVIKHGDYWLMRTRKVQPLLGMTGFLHGEPLAHEPLMATAQRRLADKTGLVLDFTLHSSGLIRMMRGDVCESFSHALILTGETVDDITISEDTTGKQEWLTARELAGPTILPSSRDIIDRITCGDHSVFDLSYELPL